MDNMSHGYSVAIREADLTNRGEGQSNTTPTQDLQNVTFVPATTRVLIRDSIVTEAYAIAKSALGDHRTGNCWILYLICRQKQPITLTEQRFAIKIEAGPDEELLVPLEEEGFTGYRAKTTVSSHNPVGPWSFPGGRRVVPFTMAQPNSSVYRVLQVLGSCGLDQFVFDDRKRGSRYWMWALACALGKYGYFTVTQAGWDEVFKNLWKKWPVGEFYLDFPLRPDDGDPGPNWEIWRSGPTDGYQVTQPMVGDP